MKHQIYLTIFLLLTIAGAIHAQTIEADETGRAKITGTIKDAGSGSPIEYATIALLDAETEKAINGNLANAKGEFVIDKVALGKYKATISFMGYETITLDNIEVTDKHQDIDLGTLSLTYSVTQLDEVVVQGERQLIEERVDRTIYNAENDKTSRGGDATDVLKRVPMLSVDLDGNVSLRGNQNIRVLINNKPSSIAASSIADALKQIPADQIKSVEVITSPSAKYDAEGSAGIINIITKKSTVQGAMLGINSAAGIRGSNLGLNGSLRTGKMGFSLGGFGRAEYNVNGSFTNKQTTLSDDGERITLQQADTRRNGLFGRYTLGWDYDINKNNFVTASVQYGVRNGTNYQDDLLTQVISPNTTTSNTRNVVVTDNSGTVDVYLDYVHLFDKPQKEFSLSGLFSRNDRIYNFENTFFGNDAVLDSLLQNRNNSYNEEITVQADYQTPINTKQLVEFGAKNIMRKVTSDYKYYHSSASGDWEEINNAASSNVFTYNQNVTAGYLSYTVGLPKDVTLKAGTRYEYTTISADFEQPTETSVTIPSYGILVPSVNLSKKLTKGNFIKLAFNRRIQRPSIQYLNPNIQAANPLYITVGNPELKPEYTNNYELAYSTYIKNSSINIALFVRNTTGSIQSIRSLVGENVVKTTYANIGEENAYGVNFNGNVSLGKRFSVNGGTDIYYTTLDNNVSDPLYHASNTGWVATARLRGNYKLNKGWELESFALVRGRQVQLQGVQGAFRIYNLGIQKELLNKKGSLGLSFENFLSSGLTIRNNTHTPLIDQQSTNVLNNFSVKINFDYRIGKMNYNKTKQKKSGKSIKNDDLKGAGSTD